MANIFMARLKAEDFQKEEDKIAVVIKDFTLLKRADGILQRYSEPYIISMAIDSWGIQERALEINIMPFPNVRKGDKVEFDGQGHLIYGPSNPGEFLVYSLLFMESDGDLRQLGQTVEQVISSEALSMGVKALMAAQPTYATAISILTQLTSLVSKQLQQNRDDELYRRSGTLLRDVVPPFDILRSYTGNNDFIEAKVSIIPLSVSNNLGQASRKMML